MALKAGRVGVAPDQVDEFGNVRSDATSGYTKQEADAKFETQTHAASTYETKSDAAALQPITLAVPIEMLSGTKLTVEDALEGLNEEKANLYDIHEWTEYSKDLMINNVKSGKFTITLNPIIKLYILQFVGNSVEIPVGTHEVDFSDVLPSLYKLHGEWVAWLRGTGNVILVHGETKKIALNVATAGTWYGGCMVGKLDTGVL